MNDTRARPSSASALAMWRRGFGVGLETIRREPVLGLKRCVLPVSYWRTAEFAYVWRRLDLPRGSRLLDLGSPKDLALHLAHDRGYELVSTDILPAEVEVSGRYARALRLAGDGPGRVRSELQDGRRLSYADESFDAAYSVSVLEHIPENGDSLAVQELMRVVRTGGVVVITVPFANTYHETYVDRSVYEREQVDGAPVFFERHYDRDALNDRLIGPSGGELADLELWGEGWVRVERLLTRLGVFGIALSPLEAFLSALFLRRITPSQDGHAMAAFLTIRKIS